MAVAAMLTWASAQPAHAQVPTPPPPAEPFTTGGAGETVSGPYTLRSDVNLVLVEATVRDQHGAIAKDLTAGQFRVEEDGVEQQIRYFSRDELPLAVALVVDRSGSMHSVLQQLHHVAYDTLSALKPGDEVALFSFAARITLIAGLTTDRRLVADRLAGIPAAGATVISDALYEAAEYLEQEAPNRRHAIILVSDNETSLKGYTDEKRVIREALEAEASIYSIRVEEGSTPHSLYVILPIFHDFSVARVVRETGGEVIDATSLDSIRPALNSAIARMKQRYTLGYYSNNHRRDQGFREISIRVTPASSQSAEKYTVYARRGYYARSGSSTPSYAHP
jgi:Ca-activated chloride channel homolog